MEVTGVQAGMDEHELIIKAGRGDAYAFEQLMSAHESKMPTSVPKKPRMATIIVSVKAPPPQ